MAEVEEEKTCFIIMPITTPDKVLESYRDQDEHFKHVLDCLFKPAVQKAGYKSIPPKAKGADLIQAEIIKNLEASDMVLCDMSSLNPNVFFEFGIRTSLNKPVCVVKDELTTKVPFDTGIINHHEYQSSLEPWLLDSEIKKLSDHIIASDKRSEGQNTLWKYFGFKSEAVPYQGEQGVETKLDYLTMQFDSLRNKLDSVVHSSELVGHGDLKEERIVDIINTILYNLPPEVSLVGYSFDSKNNRIVIRYKGKYSDLKRIKLRENIYNSYQVSLIYEDVEKL